MLGDTMGEKPPTDYLNKQFLQKNVSVLHYVSSVTTA